MSDHSEIRAAAASRWMLAALAAVALLSPAALPAQDNKDTKEAKPAPRPARKAPEHNNTNTEQRRPPVNTPPANKPAQTETHAPTPPVHTQTQSTAPANTNTSRPVQNDDTQRTRQITPPTRQPGAPTTNTNNQTPPQTNQPGRQYGNRSDTPNNQTPPANQPGRQYGNRSDTPNNQTPPQTNQPGRQFGNRGDNPGNQPANSQGRQFGDRSNPPRGGAPTVARPVYRAPNGNEVHYRPNGQPDVVRARGMTITHAPTGVRTTVYERPDHTTIVTRGVNHGYVQRPYVVNNVTYVQRTYYVSGRSYVNVYRPYSYHGISLNVYVTPRYYAPAYYSWAYNPWNRPVVYTWGWYNDPWYGYYGAYFRPYPSYPSASLWLTDYIIATTLQQAYQERVDSQAVAQANYDSNNQATLTPEVKQAISDEVRRQLDQERAESQSGGQAPGAAPSFLTDDSSHVFVVANGMSVPSRWGECTLSEGDVLQMAVAPSPNSASADLTVLAARGMDCRKGSLVTVGINELADMQNHMRSTMDQGLTDLQSHGGQNGMPAPPPAAQRAAVVAPYAAAAPPPDPNIATELQQQSQTAQQAENEVLQQADTAAPPPADSAPATVTLGMSIGDVVAMLGQPTTVADLGSKKTYFYPNMKVVFTDGKVSDVQ